MIFREEKSHWDGRKIESPTKNILYEEFHDSTDKKVYKSRVKREYLPCKVLFDINLEERRIQLRNLLEIETKGLIDEHLKRIPSVEFRKRNLLQKAIQIRRQTELERQEISKEKIYQVKQSNDDYYRKIQSQNHMKHIKDDMDKLKEIKERIKREDNCTKIFWRSKILESAEDLLIKETLIQNKKDQYKKECLEQISLREKERQRLQEENKLNRNINVERFNNLNKELLDEKEKKREDSVKNKYLYRDYLDKHLEKAKLVKDINTMQERSFDYLMKDENVQSVRKEEQSTHLKRLDNMKKLKDFLKYNDCINEKRKEDESKINELVLKTDNELHKKRRNFEIQKAKKFQDLIAGIKDYQKFQMKHADNERMERKSAELIEKEFFNNQYLEGLKKDKLKLEIQKEINANHNRDLSAQILFNNETKIGRQIEHEREKKSMQEAEENYVKTRDEIIANVKLRHLHPWRNRPQSMSDEIIK